MNDDLRRGAELLRVLAHPTRLAILDKLKDAPRCVGAINQLLDVSQPNLSQHLAVLRRERIVDFYEDGKKRCYYITSPAMARALLKFVRADYPVRALKRRAVCDIPAPATTAR